KFPQALHLAILLRHERLFHRCQFHVQVAVGKIEIRGKSLDYVSQGVTLQGKRPWLVFPAYVVEVEQASEEPLARMREVRRGLVRVDGKPAESPSQADVVAHSSPLDGFAGNQAEFRQPLEVHRLQDQLDR